MNKDFPVVKAFPRTDGVNGFMFWCPWCQKWHLHGRGEGHRVAHCEKGPLMDSGYILKGMSKRELGALKKGFV